MTDQLLTTLLQTYGSAGVIAAVAGYAIRAIQAQLTAVQDKRIADAQAATTKLLELVAAQHAHQVLLARAIDGNADAIQALRQLIESMVAERGLQRMPAAPVGRR